jgi:hypothetical protein
MLVQAPDEELLRIVGLIKSHGISRFDEVNEMIRLWRKGGALRPSTMASVVEEFNAWKVYQT